jgi:hypothetical protein
MLKVVFGENPPPLEVSPKPTEISAGPAD